MSTSQAFRVQRGHRVPHLLESALDLERAPFSLCRARRETEEKAAARDPPASWVLAELR